MKLSKFTRFVVAPLMAVCIVEVPFMLTAHADMITTDAAVAELTRAQTQEKIQNYLTRAEVQQEFLKHGVSASEASLRVAGMSNAELAQVSNQIDQGQAGGEVIVIGLGTVLVVILILLLIGRI